MRLTNSLMVKKSAACDLTRCYTTMLCLRSGILSNNPPPPTFLFLQMFFMNADSSTTEPLMSFHKPKDPWVWRSSQSSLPSELGNIGHICVQHLATFLWYDKTMAIMYCRIFQITKLHPNAWSVSLLDTLALCCSVRHLLKLYRILCIM